MVSSSDDGESLSQHFRSLHVRVLCFYIFIECGETGSLGTEATNGPIVPVSNDRWVWGICIMTVNNGKQSPFRKTCVIATLFITNST